jgi:nitrite reductase (NADH) small subunit
MQSFNTEPDDTTTPAATDRTLTLGELNKIQPGEGASLDLPDGDQLAVFNVDGEYYAIENFCPHKGAPLSEGQLCGHIVECSWHGWQFDVRTGECLTVPERIRTYKVRNEDGDLKVEIG